MKNILKPLSLLVSAATLMASFSFNTAFAATGDASTPYTLSMGSDMFTFDGWGVYPAVVPQNDMTKKLLYEDLGVNLLRIQLLGECDENDKLITSTPDFLEFIELIKQAQEYNFDYLVSVWTPPVTMKSNGRLDNGLSDGNTGYLKTDKEQAYCDYIVQVFDYIKEHSLPLPLAFSFINEPDDLRDYQACSFYDGQLERLQKLMNTTLTNAGYADILLCTPEVTSYSYHYKYFNSSLISWFRNNDLLKDEEFKNAYDILAFHGYAWDVSSNLSPIIKRSDSYMAGKEIWSTESCTDALKADTYVGPSDMLRKTNFHTQIYEANRWIYWRGFFNGESGYSAALIGSDNKNSLLATPTYYFMKALFNNVPAGSKVAKVTTNDSAYNLSPSTDVRNTDLLDIGGYRTNDGQVFTLYNSSSKAKYYNVSGLTGDTVLIYRFDNAGNIAHEKVSNAQAAYNGLCVNPGDSVIFVSGNNLSFGDDPEIGEDNTDKIVRVNYATDTAPQTDASGNANIGTVWRADGSVRNWKTSKPEYVTIRRDEQGFGDEYLVIKGQNSSYFAYTNQNPTLYKDKNWAIRFTADLNQSAWKNVFGPEDTYQTMFASTYQPFNDPSADANQNAFALIITEHGRLRVAGGQKGAYFVYMADESKLNPTDFDALDIHTYTVEKKGSDIYLTIDGIDLGKLKKMAHISNASVAYDSNAVIDIPSTWGGDVTVTDNKGGSVTHTADFDLTAYSPQLKYLAAANQVIVDGTSYAPIWQSILYPGVKDVEITEDTSLHKLTGFSDMSADFDNDYSLVFNIDSAILDDDDAKSYTVKLKNSSALESYSADTLSLSDLNKVAFRNINPSKIDDVVTAMFTVNYGSTYSGSFVKKYTLKKLCYDKLSYLDSKASLTVEEQKLRKVIVDLLNYSAAVSEYTNSKLGTHQRADYGLSAADKTISLPACTNIKSIANDVLNPLVTWSGVNAVLDNSIKLRFYMDIPADTDITTLKAVVGIEGDTAYEIPGTEFKAENGQYYFQTNNIGFLSLSKPITLQIKSGDTQISKTLTYSVESYAAYHKTQSSQSGFDKVVNTMLNLGKSISEYASLR